MRRLALISAAICLVGGAACSSQPLGSEGGEPGPGPGTPGAGGSGAASPVYDFADYPAGPYGTKKGSVIDNYEFLGWRAPKAVGYDIDSLETIRFSDFYNPGGSRSDVKLLVVNASAVWCTVCRAEYRHIRDDGIYASFRARGVEIVGTLFEDARSGPATPIDLKNWGELEAHQVEFPLVLDPSNKLGVFFSSDATPLNMLIDARTMVILDVSMGYSTDYWSSKIDGVLAAL